MLISKVVIMHKEELKTIIDSLKDTQADTSFVEIKSCEERK